MHLERLESEPVRAGEGFYVLMRVAGTGLMTRVFVSDDALAGDSILTDEKELCAQLLSDRGALEAVASQKFRQGRWAADGVVVITLSDLLNFMD